MDRRQIEQAIDHQIATLRVVAGALAVVPVVYIAVARFVIESWGNARPRVLPDAAIAVIAAGAVGLIVLAEVVTRAVLSAAREAAGAGQERLARLLQGYVASAIVGQAMREGAAVIGLVLALVTGELLWAVVLGIAAVVAMLARWPRRQGFIDWLLEQRFA